MQGLGKMFKGRRFEWNTIILCVPWYLPYKLSYRDLVAVMAERALALAHMTIIRCVQRFVPEFAVGRDGNTEDDFRFRRKRDMASAKAFFYGPLKTQDRAPSSVTRDGYAASHRAFREMSAEDAVCNDTKPRLSNDVNHMIEQDHRDMKSPMASTPGFKIFKRATVSVSGTEFDLANLGVHSHVVPALWVAALSA